jgi:hypothetical protein
MHPPVLIHTGKEGGGGQPVRRFEGRYLTRGVENINMTDCISPVYKLYLPPVKTTFRIWSLYSYLVHGEHVCRVLFMTVILALPAPRIPGGKVGEGKPHTSPR